VKCAEDTCTLEATHVPKICIPAIGWPIELHQPLSAVMTVPLCLAHARDFRVRETLELRGERTLRRIFELMAQSLKKLAPDFDRAFVVPVSMSSAEFVELDRIRNGLPPIAGHA
jgi:hypothetical protein